MLVVHHLEESRSQRIVWLLEELGLEYQIKHYKRNPRTQLAPPELRAIHPLGRSPVITDGENTVAETGAIIEYLLERYGDGRLKPAAGTTEHLRYSYWLHAGEGSVMPFLVMKRIFEATTAKPVPALIRPITRTVAKQVGRAYIEPGIRANMDLMEAALAESAWFAGSELSGADIMMSFPVETSLSRMGGSAAYPALHEFLARIHARPAYQRALNRGDGDGAESQG